MLKGVYLMKRIAIDMDEVIADLVPKVLSRFNRDSNENVTLEDIRGSKLTLLHPHLKEQIINYFIEPEFFRDLKVIQDSQEVIKKLSEHYEIFITSAAMEFPSTFTAKYEWLKEHFYF